MTVREAGASLASAFIAGAVERRVSIYDVDVCALCGDVGVMHKCTWETEKEVRIPVDKIVFGDLVKLGPNRYARVVGLSRSHDGKKVFCALRGIEQALEFPIFAEVLGRRRAPCAAACCDRCSCERGDGVHVCADHWLDWSKVV